MLFKVGVDVWSWELHLSNGGAERYSHAVSSSRVCEAGDVDVVRAMVERTAVDIHEPRRNSPSTPLLMAAFYGHLPVMQYLCEQGADKDARDGDDQTLLRTAALSGQLDVVQSLCEQGADKEGGGDYGTAPLNMIAHEGHLPMVQCLCKQDADKVARDGGGWTHVSILWETPCGAVPA